MSRNRLRRILDGAGETTTLIGAGSTFRGDFSGKGSFIVGGTVIGDCEIDGTVTLSAGGTWEGNLRATDVVIAGTIRGEVTAQNKLEIGATARVQGSVTGTEIAIAEGAVVDGGVHMTGGGRITRFTEKRAASAAGAEPR